MLLSTRDQESYQLNSRLRPKRFVYFPRYYDARKERLELKRKLYAEQGLTEEDRSLLMREKFKEKRGSQKINKNKLYTKNTRSLLLVGLVLILGYFILNGLDDIELVIFKLMD
jgi:hypothetical protein